MIMYPGVRDMVGHSVASVGTSEREKAFIAGGIVLQDGRTINKTLRPLCPATCSVAPSNREDRRCCAGHFARVDRKDFWSGSLPKNRHLRGKLLGSEIVSYVDHGWL